MLNTRIKVSEVNPADQIKQSNQIKQSEEKNNYLESTNLCYLYAEFGTGTLEEAEKYAELTVGTGGAEAADTAYWMGCCYGGYQSDDYSDVIKGLFWYEKAVELGEESGYGAERIADLYYEGKLVPKNLEKALKYYEIAASKDEFNKNAKERFAELSNRR